MRIFLNNNEIIHYPTSEFNDFEPSEKTSNINFLIKMKLSFVK